MFKIKISVIIMITFFSSLSVSEELLNLENEKRKNLIVYFQNENCTNKCKNFYRNVDITKNDNVFFVNFFNYKKNELKKDLMNINLEKEENNIFFLNNKKIPDHYVNNINLREFKNDIVGEITTTKEKNKWKIKFNPKKEEKYEKTLVNKIKNKKGKKIVNNNEFENKNLNLHYAVINEDYYLFPKNGVNESKKIIANNTVLDYKSISSKSLEWEIEIDRKKYNYEKLAIVLWIENENKEYIQSKKINFNREPY